MTIHPEGGVYFGVAILLIGLVGMDIFILDGGIQYLGLAIVFTLLMLTLSLIYAISSCRTITLGKEGIVISLLWWQKKYSWDELVSKKIIDCKNRPKYKMLFDEGILFSPKELRDIDKRIDPITLCQRNGVFSCVFIAFQEGKNYYPAPHYIQKNVLLEYLEEIGVKLD